MSLSRCIPRVRSAQLLKRAGPGAQRWYSAGVPYFENEPARPVVTTSIPGPKARGALDKIDEVFDTNNVNMVTDFERSVGNFIADPDGNLLLDVYAQIASIAVGYNNPALLAATQWPAMRSALVNRPAMGNFPQHDWAQVLQSGLLKAAPNGLDKVFTSTTGSDANELAYKAAFMWKRRQQRGEEAEFTAEEVSSAMENKGPGAPNLSILSFRGGFHGRLFGSLTTTRSKPIHKLDIPAFDWPAAPFPQLKYPLEEHARENRDEEKRCLQETERVISEWHNPPAAVIVEPIQSEGGDNHASPAFFRGLQELTKKHDILFIVDEVQTGVGATGKLWAHEHWGLPSPPDMVTFSKKAQAAGYFYSDASLRPRKAYRQFNTWMGDPVRAVMFKAMLQEIETKGLVQNTALVGEYMYRGLLRLQERFPGMVTNLRGKGQGTFIAFDCPSRDELIKKSKSVGLNIGGCGEKTIRLRPMLVFQQHHADLLLEMLERLIKR